MNRKTGVPFLLKAVLMKIGDFGTNQGFKFGDFGIFALIKFGDSGKHS